MGIVYLALAVKAQPHLRDQEDMIYNTPHHTLSQLATEATKPKLFK